MKFQVSLHIPPLPIPIRYKDKILLIGSCFTEHMATRLATHKFRVLQNPHGILFNPLSVAHSLRSYAEDRRYGDAELFYLNELWGSWDHHTRFSHVDKDAALEGINAAQAEAADAVREAGWVMITLGSAFQYFLKDGNRPVANNHRAPGSWFEKRLLDIPLIVDELEKTLRQITELNPAVRFLFTISPVRHIRDGVVDNNRSKARLIEAVHTICDRLPNAWYFPAYELVIDVLRDYRFYDIDLVHPNYAATESVWEAFVPACIDPAEVPLMEQLREITVARNHLPRFPETEAHQRFLKSYAEKVRNLQAAHPELTLADEARYFNAQF
jgi:hypothetical protein